MSDPELLAREGRFVAEGRLVVRRLLERSRFEVESVLVTPAALADMADVLGPAAERVPVYVALREVFVDVAGFNIHRGCLAIGRRPCAGDADAILQAGRGPALVVVLEALANADNVGGIFRSAQAFGVRGVLLDPTSCDPLYRKAIRTSMGASLAVPFARVGDWPGGLEALRAAGFTLVALTPDADAIDVADVVTRFGGAEAPPYRGGDHRSGDAAAAPANHEPRTNPEPGTPNGPRTKNEEPRTHHVRVALLVGNEGSGLSDAATRLADVRARIPMVSGADSLNAATATGIALHAFARYCGLV